MLVTDLRPASDGWATRSLDRSIRATVLGMVGAWQIVMILALLTADTVAWPLALAHLATGLYPLLLLRSDRALPQWPIPASMAALTLADHRTAHDAALRAEILRAVRLRAAEESRVLHDCAINTLGAIANGGASTADPEVVRDQCRADVGQLDHLRGASDRGLPDLGLADVRRLPGVTVRLVGTDDDGLRAIADRLGEGIVVGLARATREAVINARKHSGSDRIEVTLTAHPDRLTIEVRDHGIGFDGAAPAGRGLDASIMGRARDRGFSAELASAMGAGTTVTLSATLTPAAAGAGRPIPEDAGPFVARVSRRAGLLWAGGVTVVGVVLAATGGTNVGGALYPMLAIMAASWSLVALLPARPGRTWPVLPLGSATIVVFGLSAAATAYGTVSPVHWQALSATGPFILLLTSGAPRRLIVGTTAAWVVAVVVMATAVGAADRRAAATVVVAGLVGLIFSAVWARFQVAVSVMSNQAAAAHRLVREARTAEAADRAARRVHRRWLAAGVDAAVELLADVAEGRLDPQDPCVQRTCGEEEAYLRQLLLVGPGLVHLGPVLLPLLRTARERGIALSLLLGGQDAEGPEVAAAVAQTIDAGLRAVTSGRHVTVSMFPVAAGLQITLVGLDDGDGGLTVPRSLAAVATAVDTRPGLTQITVPAGVPGHGTDGYGADAERDAAVGERDGGRLESPHP